MYHARNSLTWMVLIWIPWDYWLWMSVRCIGHVFTTAQFMMTSSNGNIFRVTGHLCGNSPAPGEFATQRPVTRSFDVFFDLRLNNRLSKRSWGWWFETPSRPLWCHCNVTMTSWHVNSFCITGILGESSRDKWSLFIKGQWCEALMLPLTFKCLLEKAVEQTVE